MEIKKIEMDNVYTPPTTKTVYPPKGHLRTEPDYLHIPDEQKKEFWTNFNDDLMKSLRRIKNV